MSNYNDFLANLQDNANSKAASTNQKETLKNLKSKMTEKDYDAHFDTIHQSFYAVEKDIKAGLNQDTPIMKLEDGLQGASDFRYFTGHKFSLHYNTNAIEDNPVFATITIELPYDLKSKAESFDGLTLEDKVLNLKFDSQNNKFIWTDARSQTEVSTEDLKQYIVQVLNIKLLNTQYAF